MIIPIYWRTTMTNREWLNSLSDKEIINIVGIDVITEIFCKTMPCSSDEIVSCQDCAYKWLKQEHKENE